MTDQERKAPCQRLSILKSIHLFRNEHYLLPALIVDSYHIFLETLYYIYMGTRTFKISNGKQAACLCSAAPEPIDVPT